MGDHLLRRFAHRGLADVDLGLAPIEARRPRVGRFERLPQRAGVGVSGALAMRQRRGFASVARAIRRLRLHHRAAQRFEHGQQIAGRNGALVQFCEQRDQAMLRGARVQQRQFGQPSFDVIDVTNTLPLIEQPLRGLHAVPH